MLIHICVVLGRRTAIGLGRLLLFDKVLEFGVIRVLGPRLEDIVVDHIDELVVRLDLLRPLHPS